jgi:hypothetical protein
LLTLNDSGGQLDRFPILRYHPSSLGVAPIQRLLIGLCCVLAMGSAAKADILVLGLGGVFTNPNGGVNTGVGSANFTTGSPFSATDLPNAASFEPYPMLYGVGNALALPTAPQPLGVATFYNGVTVTGTSASSVQLELNGTAQFLDITPNIYRPIRASKTITLSVTPNTTGDAVLDGDFWSSENGSTILIPEDSSRTVEIWGRFIPMEIASPPKYLDIEITEFRTLDGSINTGPPKSVPAPAGLILGVLGAALGVIWRKKGS